MQGKKHQIDDPNNQYPEKYQREIQNFRKKFVRVEFIQNCV